MENKTDEKNFKFVKGIDENFKLIASLDENNRLEVYEKGAHISSWVSNGKEQLFLSKKAKFAQNTALRGGIPIIFPQFSDMGNIIKHGFARITKWYLDSYYLERNTITISFILQDTEETLKIWPHHFKFSYKITMSENKLSIDYSVGNRNENGESFPFQTALHTYFLIPNIHTLKIQNLSGVKYIDNCNGRQEFVDENEELQFNKELDAIYLNTPPEILIMDDKSPYFLVSKGISSPDAGNYFDLIIYNILN